MTKILAGRGDGEEPAADCKPMGKRGNHRAGRYPLRLTRPGIPAGGGGGGGEFPCGGSRPAWPNSAGKDQGKEFQGPRQELLSRNGWGGLTLGKI